MFSKKRLFTIITVVTLLALLPTAALANSRTVLGVTISFPDSRVDCDPTDLIGFTAPLGTEFDYHFFLYDNTTGLIKELGYGTLIGTGSEISVPFPYPEITGTLTFFIRIRVGGVQGSSYKWTITCEPTTGGEGCTPGYWKNHYEDWAAPYTPDYSFNSAFSIGADYYAPGFFSDSYTLGQAINQGGGGLNRLARHGTAALLSAASPFVDYPYTVAQVINMVQNGIIDPLAQANELGCPLD